MKNRCKVVVLLAILLLFSTSCYFGKQLNDDFPDDFYIGVIQTTEQAQSTMVSFYDENLEKVGTLNLPYGIVGNSFKTPTCNNEHLYVNAAGLMGEKNLGLSLDIDLNTGNLKKYKHSLVGPADCVETDKFIFVCNNLNNLSHIVRCNKDTGEAIEFTKEVSLIDTLFCSENHLIAFAENLGTQEGSYIYIRFGFESFRYNRYHENRKWCSPYV